MELEINNGDYHQNHQEPLPNAQQPVNHQVPLLDAQQPVNEPVKISLWVNVSRFLGLGAAYPLFLRQIFWLIVLIIFPIFCVYLVNELWIYKKHCGPFEFSELPSFFMNKCPSDGDTIVDYGFFLDSLKKRMYLDLAISVYMVFVLIIIYVWAKK